MAPCLLTMPVEVFEMIVGAIRFVDLPHFLKTSKAINIAFTKTRYNCQLASIAWDDLRELELVLRSFHKADQYTRTHEILKTFTNPHCQRCGNYAFIFLWLCIQPLKLCQRCVLLARYHLIRLDDGLKFYNLKETDVEWVPKLKWCLGNNIENGKAVVCRYSLMPESERDGLQPLLPISRYVPCDTRNWTYWSNWCLAGAMKVTRMFDPKSGQMLKELICYHCSEPESWDPLRYGPSPATSIPHSFEYLRQHIETHHNNLLDSFMEGWFSLSDEMKSKFLAHETDIPGKSRYVPRRLRCRRVQILQRPLRPRGWISWVNFMLEEVKETPFSELEAQGFVAAQMDDVGCIFGIPKNPEGYQNVIGAPGDWNAKHFIAKRVVALCLNRMKIDVWDRIKNQVERDGIGVLQSILRGDSVLDLIIGTQASKTSQ